MEHELQDIIEKWTSDAMMNGRRSDVEYAIKMAIKEALHLHGVIGSLPLVLDQLDTGEWVVKCNGQIVNNAGMSEDGKKEALYWIYMNAICYKRQ